MLVVMDADLRGLKKETETIYVYTRDLDTGEVKIITEPVYAPDIFSRETMPIMPFSLSKAMSLYKAQDLISELSDDFSDLDFSVLRGEMIQIIARGMRTDLKEMGKQVSTFTLAGNRMLSPKFWIKKQLNIPYSTLVKENGNWIVGEKVPLEEIIERLYAFDTEWRAWEDEIKLEYLSNSDEEIKEFLKDKVATPIESLWSLKQHELVRAVEKYFNFAIQTGLIEEEPITLQLANQKGMDPVIHYLQHLAKEGIEKEILLSTGPATLIPYKSENAIEMVQSLYTLLEELKPIGLVTQNGMMFDLLKIRAYVEGVRAKAKQNGETFPIAPFRIGGENIRKTSSGGFFPKVENYTTHIYDFAPFSQHWFPFTIDNKLDTIMSMILGYKVQKRESYADLTRLWIEQSIGREEAALEFEKYSSEDVTFMLDSGKFIANMTYLLANLFSGCNPADVCNTSKKQLALKRYNSMAIEKLKRAWWSWEDKQSYNDDNFNSPNEFMRLVDPGTYKLMKTKKGIFDDVSLYYIAPFNMMIRQLEENHDLMPIYEYIESLDIGEHSSQKTLERFVLTYAIEEGYLLPHIFMSERFPDAIPKERFDRLIYETDFLNKAGNFMVFGKSPDLEDIMHGFGIKITEGRLLSFGSASFALYNGVNYFKQGVDTKGNRGWKTIYQTELIREIIKKTFEESTESALRYVADWFADLRNGEVDRNKLINFKASVTRDYWDYSSPAQQQKMVQAFIEFGIRKGDKYAKVELVDGKVDLTDLLEMPAEMLFSEENIEFLVDGYLGPSHSRGRSLGKGKIGKYVAPHIHILSKDYGVSVGELTEFIADGQYPFLW